MPAAGSVWGPTHEHTLGPGNIGRAATEHCQRTGLVDLCVHVHGRLWIAQGSKTEAVWDYQGEHDRWEVMKEGLQTTMLLHLQVNEGAKTGCLQKRNWRTFWCQTNAPTHMGVLSWTGGPPWQGLTTVPASEYQDRVWTMLGRTMTLTSSQENWVW